MTWIGRTVKMRAMSGLAALLVLACGCSQTSEDKLQTMELRLIALENQQKTMREAIDNQARAIDQLGLDVLLEGADRAAVSTTGGGYGIAKSNLLPFTVAVKKAVPYLAGFKLTLSIGNPSSATFDGAKLNVRWRPASDPVNQAAQGTPQMATMEEKEFKITEKLHPGAFNDTEIILSPVTAQDIKILWIGIETDNVLLRRR